MLVKIIVINVLDSILYRNRRNMKVVEENCSKVCQTCTVLELHVLSYPLTGSRCWFWNEPVDFFGFFQDSGSCATDTFTTVKVMSTTSVSCTGLLSQRLGPGSLHVWTEHDSWDLLDQNTSAWKKSPPFIHPSPSRHPPFIQPSPTLHPVNIHPSPVSMNKSSVWDTKSHETIQLKHFDSLLQ